MIKQYSLSEEIEETEKKGDNLMDSAYQVLKEPIKTSYIFFSNRGYVLNKAKNLFTEALLIFEKLASVDNSSKLYYKAGKACMELALIQKENTGFLFNCEKTDLISAIDYTKKSIEYFQNNNDLIEYYNQLIICYVYYCRFLYDENVRTNKHIIKHIMSNELLPCYKNKYNVYIKLKEYKKAGNYIIKCLKQDNFVDYINHYDIISLLQDAKECYIKANLYDDAIICLKRIIKLEHRDNHTNIANHYVELGNIFKLFDEQIMVKYYRLAIEKFNHVSDEENISKYTNIIKIVDQLKTPWTKVHGFSPNP